VKEKISEEYQSKISLQAECDLFVGYVVSVYLWMFKPYQLFYSVISSAILVLLRELEASIEQPLLTMQRTSWTTVDTVSGESAYIGELVLAVEEVVSVVRDHIEQKKYLRNFFDKASRLATHRNSSFPDPLTLASALSSQSLRMLW